MDSVGATGFPKQMDENLPKDTEVLIMAVEHEVTVYSTPSCPWCTKATAYLKKVGVDFEEKDVSVDIQAAREMVKVSGQMGVPVLTIDGTVVVGFDKNRIDSLLGL